jgi:hexosaminidase
MKLIFAGNVSGLEQGIRILATGMGIVAAFSAEAADDADGGGAILVEVEKSGGTLQVIMENGYGTIRYNESVHFFRALGLFVEHARQTSEFHLTEQPLFDMNGGMFDVSRNAVLKVDSVKRLICHMALMGLNTMMLYTEDTYTLETMPYFGYMRGRYSPKELQSCDDYAALFGIEIVPCIQTLAHLKLALQWNYATGMKDTHDILLAGEEQTYRFIDDMIRAASAPFRSKRIHIGMDEAHDLGLGKYLEINGYQRRFDIMNNHLLKVLAITRKYGLEPMIWSDMYFRLASSAGNYFDLEAVVPEDVIRGMPEGVRFVYWDYYREDESHYAEYIRRHKRFGSNPIFAGGVWTWNGIAPNYGKTFVTTNQALAACKKEGIREVFTTMWGDNGAETNVFTCLLGMQLFAEHGYHLNPDMETLGRRFATCTGCDTDDFMSLRYFDEVPGVQENNPKSSNPSKFLLWQDVLIGLFDENVAGTDLTEHYLQRVGQMRDAAVKNPGFEALFGVYEKLADVLSVKWNLGIRLKSAYDDGDRRQLMELKTVLDVLQAKLRDLREAHRKQWYEAFKPFGWEVIDIRYGGLSARLESAAIRLEDYLQGRISHIEELEERRLYFDWPVSRSEDSLGRCNQYQRIVTANLF